MGIVKEFLLFSLYFLLLSTTLHSQEMYRILAALLTAMPSRIWAVFFYILIAMFCYITLVITPFLNFNLRKLSLGACGILIGKYIFRLASLGGIMVNILGLVATLLDVVGQSIFYLTSIRVVQMICEKHGATDKSGRLFAMLGGLYALSRVLGYMISYGTLKGFGDQYEWKSLLMLMCMTLISGVICFFAFPGERRAAPAHQLQEERPQVSARPAVQGVAGEGVAQPSGVRQIYRDGIAIGQVFRKTFFLHKKMFLIRQVQITLGILLSSIGHLLIYLMITSQDVDLEHVSANQLQIIIIMLSVIAQIVIHIVQVLLIFGCGGILASIVIGLLCDCISVKKMGFVVLIITILTLLFLYSAIAVNHIQTTLVAYLFLGMSVFGLWTWLLCAGSKIYAGTFQSFGVIMQSILIPMGINDICIILFSGGTNAVYFYIQVSVLIVLALISIIYVRNLPSGQIEIVFEESQIEASQANQRQEQPRVDVEMAGQEDPNTRKVEEEIEQKQVEKVIGPQNLL